MMTDVRGRNMSYRKYTVLMKSAVFTLTKNWNKRKQHNEAAERGAVQQNWTVSRTIQTDRQTDSSYCCSRKTWLKQQHTSSVISFSQVCVCGRGPAVPLKRLEIAFTESHYYLHMIAFQGEDMGGRRSIKQTNTSLVSSHHWTCRESSCYEQYLLLVRGWGNDYRYQSLGQTTSC
jgi:hypothetical protein